MKGLLIAVALAVALVGCGDRGNQVDFGGEEMGPDVHAVVSEDGNVKLGLTLEYVYFALSDSARAEAQRELDDDAEAEGVKGFFGGVMRGVLGKALAFRARYPVAEIQDIRWEDGRMRLEFTDPDRRLDDNLQVEDEPVTEAFSEEAVREFSAVFRTLKEEQSAGQR